MSTYSVAIIGCGARGRLHIPGVMDDSRATLAALVDINQEGAIALRDELCPDAKVFTDHKAMLAEVKPDVVIITLWTGLHLPIYRDCAQGGVKSVLCEKPLAATWGECQEIDSIAKATGCNLALSYQRRFSEGNLLIRKTIKEGTLGKVERMELTSFKHMLDCGTHSIDQAISFMDEARVKWILGAVDNTEIIDFFNVKCAMMSVATMVFDNGVRATIQCGEPDLDFDHGVRVHCEDGFIQCNWPGEIARAIKYSDPSWSLSVDGGTTNEYMIDKMVKHTIDCLASGALHETDYTRGMYAAEIAFAFYESVRQHKRIELPISGFTDNPYYAEFVD